MQKVRAKPTTCNLWITFKLVLWIGTEGWDSNRTSTESISAAKSRPALHHLRSCSNNFTRENQARSTNSWFSGLRSVRLADLSQMSHHRGIVYLRDASKLIDEEWNDFRLPSKLCVKTQTTFEWYFFCSFRTSVSILQSWSQKRSCMWMKLRNWGILASGHSNCVMSL